MPKSVTSFGSQTNIEKFRNMPQDKVLAAAALSSWVDGYVIST